MIGLDRKWDKPAGWLLPLVLSLALTGCAASPQPEQSSSLPEQSSALESKALEIVFPAYTEENPHQLPIIEQINEGDPVSVAVELPQGWTAERMDAVEEPVVPGEFFSILYLYHDQQLMGYIGFNRFEPSADEVPQEDYYKTVCPGLRLSSLYQWELSQRVKDTGTGEVLIMQIDYSIPEEGKNTAELPLQNTLGILAYDTRQKAVVGIAFQPGAVEETQAEAIAQSFQFYTKP